MPLYLFHLHECGTETPDPEGRQLADLDAAIGAAEADALSIMAQEVRYGHLCLGCHIEIVEHATGRRATLAFRDVLEITGV